MKKHYLLLLILIPILLKAQEKRKYFYGTLKTKSVVIANAHIINLKTGQGAFSNDTGNFRILAKVQDSLSISYVGFKTETLIVKPIHFGMQTNNIELTKSSIALDEVEVKKHNFLGILSKDMEQTPEDIAIVKSKGALDFSNIDFKQPTIKVIDDFSRKKAPDARKLTDPTAKFAGVGTTIGGLDKYALELRKQRKEINYKENFPKMLLSEFGSYFFFNELKIPKDNYYHFLEFCNSFNIEGLYKENKVLDVINILRRESKKYLLIINKENE
ncbi:conserved protein of unknown function [Tenacibaculum sp. 190130A14a]|uniref:Carboxypeptidase-like protein n=1 Tax=Tenacibaculum polynesiense TaxID=3137857 RepID=A0ABM9PC82_9FLAO